MGKQDWLARILSIRAQRTGDSIRPHKYILLLSVAEMIGRGKHTNKFTYDELSSVFDAVAVECGLARTANGLEYPFFHLHADGFWMFQLLPGQDGVFESYVQARLPRRRMTARRIRETIEYAYLDPALFACLLDESFREQATLQMRARLRSCSVLTDQTTSRFAYEAEALTEALTGLRRDAQVIGDGIPNYELHDASTNDYLECDLIVATHTGLFVIELKHWTGSIEVKPQNWLQNGLYRKDPHRTNSYKCRVLRGVLEKRFRHQDIPWVESIVVLTHPDASVLGAHPRTVPRETHNLTFHSVARLLEFLRYREQSASECLSDAEIQSIKAFLLAEASGRAPVLRDEFAGYETVERITSRPTYRELLVRPIEGRHRRLERLRIFAEDPRLNEHDKAVLRERGLRTLDTVSAIGSDHANIHVVHRLPNDSGLIVEAGEWSEEGTLADALVDSPNGLGMERSLSIFRGIVNGLRVVHDHSILHRALKPENVLLVDDVPKLMNFELAYHLDAQQTVLPEVDRLPRDAYTAPELFAGDVWEASDLFSAGVIFFEMLTGHTPFRSATDLQRLGGVLPRDQRELLEAASVPANCVALLVSLLQHDVLARPQNAADVLSALRPSFDARPKKVASTIDPGDEFGSYRILQLIGRGASADVYLADRMNYGHIALKVFFSDVPRSQSFAEERHAREVSSPYVVHCNHASVWSDNRFFLELNYVPGQLMRTRLTTGKLPSLEEFQQVSRCLLLGLRDLHRSGGDAQVVLHNDIKPDNILLGEDKAVLIDLGAARSPGVGPYAGTASYVAPDLCHGSDLEYSANGDIFALGATLFEFLFGVKPYGEVPRVASELVDVAGVRNDVPDCLIDFLRRSLATTHGARFAAVDEMIVAFDAVWRPEEVTTAGDEVVEPIVERVSPPAADLAALDHHCTCNPFVTYLNSLQNVTSGNRNALAEAQATSPYFGYIHVPLPLTKDIVEALLAQEKRHVILSGHAGDGKTTIALDVLKRLRKLDPVAPLSSPMGVREQFEVAGRTIVLVKDMSELTESDRLSLLVDACSGSDTRYLIISNTGTLLDAFRSYVRSQGGDPLVIVSHILGHLQQPGGGQQPVGRASFRIINLALSDNIPLAIAVLARVVAHERWQPCAECEISQRCSVYRNATVIREHWDISAKRIELLYRRMHGYGARLTIRQLAAHLAYAVTAGLTPDTIRHQATRAAGRPLREFLFYNRFFGDDGHQDVREADHLRPVRVCRSEAFGMQPFVPIDRLLIKHGGADELRRLLPESARVLLDQVFGATDLSPADCRRQLRRILYFFGIWTGAATGFLSAFLHSRMIESYRCWLDGPSGALNGLEGHRLLSNILRVLQEHFTGARLPEGTDTERLYITLSRSGQNVRQSSQIVLGSFDAKDFRLFMSTTTAGIRSLYLMHQPSHQSLLMDLPLLDFVMMRHTGEVGRKMNTSFVDRLDRFKACLLNYHRSINSAPDSSQELTLVHLRTEGEFTRHQIHIASDTGLEVF